MSSRPAPKTALLPRKSEIVIDFVPERVAAPFFLRCGAMLIDYIVLLIAPVFMMLAGRYFGRDGARLVGGDLNDTGWLIAIILGGTNFILLPMFSGRSIGKIMTGLRIVSSDGRPAQPAKAALRNTVGYLLTALTLGLGFIISAFTRSGRTLHDLLFGTVVIFADRRLK